MRWEWAIVQTSWHINPAQSVLVQNERRIAGNCLEAFCTYLRLVVGSLTWHKSGNVDAGPFVRVPPHEFFSFAPGTTVRPRTGAIVNDSAIAGPTEAPAVSEVISGFSRVRFVHAVAAENTGINPAAACGRSVSFQFSKTIHLRPMMRITIAVDAEHDALVPAAVRARGYSCVPAVDLCEHGFHFWIALFVFRIPPVERAQRFVDRVIGTFCFRNQTQCQLMNEPRVRAAVAWWINGFLAPLQ